LDIEVDGELATVAVQPIGDTVLNGRISDAYREKYGLA
jgi:hypothetical protein